MCASVCERESGKNGNSFSKLCHYGISEQSAKIKLPKIFLASATSCFSVLGSLFFKKNSKSSILLIACTVSNVHLFMSSIAFGPITHQLDLVWLGIKIFELTPVLAKIWVLILVFEFTIDQK